MAKSQTRTRWTETRRRRWKVADAEEVLAALERSGLPTSRFAAEHGLEAERLRRWRRRLEAERAQRRRRPKRPAHGEPVRFAELAVPRSGSPGAGVSGQFEVVLGNGQN